MNSMASNQVWDLVELFDGVKSIGCKWVFKTKDSFGSIERLLDRIRVYTQVYNTITKRLLSNPRQRRHKTCWTHIRMDMDQNTYSNL